MNNVLDLIKSWPSLQTMSPSEVLASPAWKYDVTFDGRNASLTRLPNDATDELLLSISFDGEPHLLGLRKSSYYPDLNLLWSQRAALPTALILALVEKECGAVLQMIENISRREVKLLGLANSVPLANRIVLRCSVQSQKIDFSIDLSKEFLQEFGNKIYLDPKHSEIRSLTRTIRAHYVKFDIPSEEISQLSADDFLMLENVSPKWIADIPNDNVLHVVSAVDTVVTFADFVDGKLPAIPKLEDANLHLFYKGNPLFKVVVSNVGEVSGLRLQVKD